MISDFLCIDKWVILVMEWRMVMNLCVSVVFVYGLGEYCGRYEEVVERFVFV